jgi:putative transcriptional regulator
MFALARRGLTMLRAKRAVEALVANGRVFVELPIVEDRAVLRDELARAGVAAAPVEPPAAFDVRGLRQRLKLTRVQFAVRYGLEVETVRNWETGKREPDTTARSYLRAISNDPERVEQAYAPAP